MATKKRRYKTYPKGKLYRKNLQFLNTVEKIEKLSMNKGAKQALIDALGKHYHSL